MYRQIHSEMWREGWFERWGSSTKLVFLCLLTGSEIRPSGFLIETPERIAFATGLTAECVRTSLAGMLPKVVWWSDHDAIWIVRFFRWQGAGPKWIRAVQKDVVALPSYARTAWDAEYPPDTLSIGYAYPSDGYTGKDFHNPVTHKEQEQEQEQEQDRNRTGQEQHSTPVPLPSPRSETAVSSPAKKRGRPKNEFVPLGDDFETRMLARFPILGTILIHEQIELALSHTAHLKHANMELYCQNWLRREAERITGGNDGKARDNPQGQYPSPAHIPGSEHTIPDADYPAWVPLPSRVGL